jgi:hypothetical protein
MTGLMSTAKCSMCWRLAATLGRIRRWPRCWNTAGTSPPQFQPSVGQWLTTMAGLTAELGGEIEVGEYRNATSPVGLDRWAVAKLVDTSLVRGVSAEPLTTLRALLDRAVADGRADESVGSLFESLRSGPRSPAVL